MTYHIYYSPLESFQQNPIALGVLFSDVPNAPLKG